MTSINDTVLEILRDNPRLNNEQVAEEVQRRVLGATTSAASVSSIKSKAKRSGVQFGVVDDLVPMTTAEPEPLLPEETPEERDDRIRRRYATLTRMATRVADGGLPAMIVSGPPGLGKSYEVERILDEREVEHDIISGSITAVGLYIALWNMKDGGVVVLDDCDDVFRDETSLNLLKAVLDSSETRRVSYRKKAYWMEEMDIPSTFEFRGSVVFCTNVDFELAIRKGSSMAPHFGALMDRCLYLSLTMRTTEDFLARIRHVAVEDGMLMSKGLTFEEAEEVYEFIRSNASRFYGLSLRLAHQIALCYVADRENWKDDVTATKMRTV